MKSGIANKCEKKKISFCESLNLILISLKKTEKQLFSAKSNLKLIEKLTGRKNIKITETLGTLGLNFINILRTNFLYVGVNFINVLRARFSYVSRFSAAFSIYAQV